MTGRRDPLTVAAVALAVVAFAGSFDHVRSVVAAHGQAGWLSWAIAAMPEVSVTLAVLKVRRARRTGEATGWAWVVGGSAAGFTLSANLATAEPTPWGYVVAAWPAWATISAAGLIEMRPTGQPSGQTGKTTGQTAGQRSGRDRSARSASTTTTGQTAGHVTGQAAGRPAVTSATASASTADTAPSVTGPTAVTSGAPTGGHAAAVDVSDLLVVGQAVAADLRRTGQKVTRAALQAGVRDRGHTCSTARAQALLTAVRDARLSA